MRSRGSRPIAQRPLIPIAVCRLVGMIMVDKI
jgi:hypothetical protein